MFGIGTTELVVILLVALVILGPKKLPEIARALGKGLGEFRRVSSDLQRTVNHEIQREEQEERKKKAQEELKKKAEAEAPKAEAPKPEAPETAQAEPQPDGEQAADSGEKA